MSIMLELPNHLDLPHSMHLMDLAQDGPDSYSSREIMLGHGIYIKIEVDVFEGQAAMGIRLLNTPKDQKTLIRTTNIHDVQSLLRAIMSASIIMKENTP